MWKYGQCKNLHDSYTCDIPTVWWIWLMRGTLAVGVTFSFGMWLCRCATTAVCCGTFCEHKVWDAIACIHVWTDLSQEVCNSNKQHWDTEETNLWVIKSNRLLEQWELRDAHLRLCIRICRWGHKLEWLQMVLDHVKWKGPLINADSQRAGTLVGNPNWTYNFDC